MVTLPQFQFTKLERFYGSRLEMICSTHTKIVHFLHIKKIQNWDNIHTHNFCLNHVSFLTSFIPKLLVYSRFEGRSRLHDDIYQIFNDIRVANATIALSLPNFYDAM